MRLHCLGTAGYHPNALRHTSCYFLPQPGIVLDAGSGMFRLTPLIETRSLDVLLSHAHLDHVLGLTFLLGILHRRPVERLRIWGEAEKLEAIQTHLFSKLLFPAPLQAEWCPLEGESSVRLGDVALSWRLQSHPGGSLAFRLDWQFPSRSLVYATDTCGDHTTEVLDWMGQADLMLHECFFRDPQRSWAEQTGHTWTSRVAEVARATRPKRLLLTHLNPAEADADPVGLASVGERYSGDVSVAQDKMVVDF